MNLPKKTIFSIGEAANELGISISTLRRWEREGKISVGRTAGGKRAFTNEDLQLLKSPIKTEIKIGAPIKSSLLTPTKALVLFLFLISIATNAILFSFTPYSKELTAKAQDALNLAKNKASGLLVNLVEEGVKNKVSVGEQVLLAEIPQDLSINSLTLSDDLKVGGDGSIEGTLTVSSESNLYSLNVSNNLNVTGDSLLTGTLNVGGTINGNTLSSTALTFTGTSASIYPSSSDTSLFLNGGTTGTVNIGNSSTGDIHIGGGSSSSGCTITNNNGSLNCSSDITTGGNLRVNGGTLSTTQTTLSIDVANTGTINFRDSSNTLVSITDEGTTGNINVTGIYKIGGTTGKTIATCGSSQYLGGIAITGGIVTTLGNCNDVSSTTGTDLTLSGDLAVNGGDITSTSSTFNLLNQPTTLNIGSTNVTRAVNIGTGTNADTINIGTGTGTADTINIGGISGTTVNITGGTVNITGNLVSTGTVQGTRLISTIATGTAPLTVASTTVVPNLNASLLEGNSASTVMSQPQPNLVLNSDFGRRNKWMTFMPETFTDTSGVTLISGTAPTAAANILTAGAASAEQIYAEGLTTWRDARFSGQVKLTTCAGGAVVGVGKVVDASNFVVTRLGCNQIQLVKRISGVESTVGSDFAYTPTLNNWYWLELEAQGTTYIVKVYSSGASPVAKSSATLVGTISGTVSDAAIVTGRLMFLANVNMTTAVQFGGLNSGDGGVYVEGWGPESVSVAFTSTLGGQAIGFDETADSGPLGKQWAMRVWNPAAGSRGMNFTFDNTPDGSVAPSTAYMASVYVKRISGTTFAFRGTPILKNSAGTDVQSGAVLDIDSTTSTSAYARLTSSMSGISTARRAGLIFQNTLGGASGSYEILFSSIQFEQGSTATPWRNAPADDGPIVWYLPLLIGNPLGSTLFEVDPRDTSGNLFIPWDATVNNMHQVDGVMGNTGTSQSRIRVDGADISPYTYQARLGATAGITQTMSADIPIRLAAGKHRFSLWAEQLTASSFQVLGAAGVSYVRITATRGKFDLAEEYSVQDQSIEAGDIVKLSGGNGSTGSPSSTTVEKTIGGYSQDILGIISTDPGITLGNYNSSDGSIIDGNYQSRYGQGSTLRPVALQGRVPVKVTSENGPIKRGDILTSSATLPGYAMLATRAGRSIGTAMEDLPIGVTEGKVMTFVNLSFYDPQVYITDSGTLSVIKVGSTPVLLSSSSTGGVGGDITIDNSTTETKQSFTYQIQDRVTKEIIERIGAFNNLFVANLKVGSIDVDKITSKELDSLTLSLTDLLTNQASLSGRIEFLEKIGTESATLDSLSASVLGISDPLSSSSGELSGTLTVLGKTLLSNLGVTGTIQSGLLSIEGINSLGNSAINTLNGDLYLQNNLLGGVNILSGKVTIDREGNVRVEGEIKANKLSVRGDNPDSASAGTTTLPAGNTFISVLTTAVTNKSKIFVTAKNNTGKQPLIVDNENPGVGFNVRIEEPYTSNINFNWWILDVK